MSIPIYSSDHDKFISDLTDWYNTSGQNKYDEVVTISDHMLQAATIAHDEGANKTDVLSCLFHDIGHMIIDDDENYIKDAISSEEQASRAAHNDERFMIDMDSKFDMNTFLEKYNIDNTDYSVESKERKREVFDSLFLSEINDPKDRIPAAQIVDNVLKRISIKKKIKLINIFYLTILKFSFEIICSIFFIGDGNSIRSIKITATNSIAKNKIILINILMAPEVFPILVFFSNCIYC